MITVIIEFALRPGMESAFETALAEMRERIKLYGGLTPSILAFKDWGARKYSPGTGFESLSWNGDTGLTA